MSNADQFLKFFPLPCSHPGALPRPTTLSCNVPPFFYPVFQVFESLSPNLFLPLKILSDRVISYPNKDYCRFELGVLS